MATSRARAALDAWLAQADEVLRGDEESDAREDRNEGPIEHDDAA